MVDAYHPSFSIDGLTPKYAIAQSVTGLGMSSGYETSLLEPGVVYSPSDWLPIGSSEYWLAGAALALLAVIVWYARGSGRVGAFTLAAVWGVVGIGLFMYTMWMIEQSRNIMPEMAVWLIATGLCAAGWAYFRPERWQTTLTSISVVTLAVGVTGLLTAWTNYRADELLVAGGLVLLAWWERSWLVAALAGAILAIEAVPMPTLIQLVLVTGLLFGGAFVALLLRGVRSA
nr:hypothetical protein [Kibdelosporangium sp. MJ126-NF4]